MNVVPLGEDPANYAVELTPNALLTVDIKNSVITEYYNSHISGKDFLTPLKTFNLYGKYTIFE